MTCYTKGQLAAVKLAFGKKVQEAIASKTWIACVEIALDVSLRKPIVDAGKQLDLRALLDDETDEPQGR